MGFQEPPRPQLKAQEGELGSVPTWSAEGGQVSSHTSNHPRGPWGGAAPTSPVDVQSACTGIAVLVTKLLRSFNTSW